MNNELDIQLIEAYLEDELNSKDRAEFENRLSIDENFRILFREEQLIKNALNDKEAQELLATISQVTQDGRNSGRIESFRKYTWAGLSIAATLLVLLMYNLYSPDQASSEELFQTYYTSHPMVLSQRGENQNAVDELVSSYGKENWKRVNELLPLISTDVLPVPLNDLYKSITFLEQDQAQESIDLLSKYVTEPASDLYQNDLIWYLTLSHLSIGNTKASKDLLEGLQLKTNSISKLGKQVQGLLEEL